MGRRARLPYVFATRRNRRITSLRYLCCDRNSSRFNGTQNLKLRRDGLTAGQRSFLRASPLATTLLALVGVQRTIAGQYSIDIFGDPYHPSLVDSWLFDSNNQGRSTGYMIQNSGAGPVSQGSASIVQCFWRLVTS